jgi:hypothetical protein
MYEYTPPVSTACTCHYPCELYTTQQPYALGLPSPAPSQCLDMEGTSLHLNIISHIYYQIYQSSFSFLSFIYKISFYFVYKYKGDKIRFRIFVHFSCTWKVKRGIVFHLNHGRFCLKNRGWFRIECRWGRIGLRVSFLCDNELQNLWRRSDHADHLLLGSSPKALIRRTIHIQVMAHRIKSMTWFKLAKNEIKRLTLILPLKIAWHYNSMAGYEAQRGGDGWR